MKYLLRNIVARKLIKIKVEQGEGLIKHTKNLPFFCLANHNIFIHTVITRNKLVIIYITTN
jgi:hypothetical protein